MSPENPEELWKTVRGELEIVANPAHFKTNIPGTYIKYIDEDSKVIEITCSSDFQRNFVEERFYGHLKQIFSKHAGPEYKLMFSVTKKEPTQLSTSDLGPLFQQTSQDEEDNLIERSKNSGLNPQYTMKRFIVGDNCRLAYAVATAISDAPGKVYNPFFLYAGVGLGKTHLIQAIGHQVLEKHPGMKVMYKTGEQFLNEVVEAVRKGSQSNPLKRNEFKNKYRNVDVLIIDDIHAIAGKPQTQEEFFHTFNTLFMAQKQIILTSDRAPHEIRTLEERLSSRFSSGMIADIQAPGIETRLAILRERNEEMNLNAPDEVLQHIASMVDTNVRELEAKLLQAVTKAKTEGLEINRQNMSDIMGELDKEKRKRVSPAIVIREVGKYYGVTLKELKGERRLKTVVMPRQVCMFLLRDYIGMGFLAIGEALGGRDHSTIIHGVEKIEQRYKTDQALLKEIRQIKENISISLNT